MNATFRNRFFWIVLIFLGTSVGSCFSLKATPGKELVLIEKGKSSYHIVLPVRPTVVEQTAAKELQEYVQKSLGVTLPVVMEDEGIRKGIYIGNTNFAAAAGISDSRDEAWIIAAVKGQLVITGGKTRGVLYAVYHFLEDIVGVRWWNPWEEDVPELSTLKVPDQCDMRGNPSFAYRDLYDSLFDDQGIDPKPVAEPYSLYMVRNRLNGHFGFTPKEYGGRIAYGKPYHVHTFSRYFPVKQYFDQHSDWYAWSKDKKQRIPNGQLCLSNNTLLEAFRHKVEDSIRISYEIADKRGEERPLFFSVSLNDVGGLCECEECAASIQNKGESGYALSFVNKIADYIAPLFPDARIETLSYWQYRIPPKDDTKPAKNVVIRLAEDHKDLMRPVDHPHNAEVLDRLKKWSDLCDHNNLYIWDYYLNYSNASNSSVFRFERDMRIFKEHNVQGLFGEIEWPLVADSWTLRIWVLAKLLENVDLQADDLIDEFLRRYYGAAADPIKEYYYLIKVATDSSDAFVSFRTNLFNEKYVNLDLASGGNRLFEQALENVKENDVLSRRVRHARTHLDKFIVNRNQVFASEAKSRGINFASTGLDRKQAARRIVDSLKEMMKVAVADQKTIREIDIYQKIADAETVQEPVTLTESFRWVFGDLINSDTAMVRKVLAGQPGKRHYVDRDNDGTPEEVWFVDISPRHNARNLPMLVKAVDEDDDLVMGGEPDLDSDLYLADWNGDGTFNVITDYEDNDGDQDADQMAFYFYDRNHGLRAWWGRDDGDDNLLWYDVDYTYYQRQCEMNTHFGGDETFVSFSIKPGDKKWSPFWENPFLFYDIDKDGVTEEVFRIEAVESRLYSVRWSFDADNDAVAGSPRDFDVSMSSYYGDTAAEKFGFKSPKRPVLNFAFGSSFSEQVSLRGIPTGEFLSRNRIKTFLRDVVAEKALMTWDENDLNIAWDPKEILRTMERWEGIIAPPIADPGFEMPVIGGPNCGIYNKRFELLTQPEAPFVYYFNPSDRRIHVKESERTWIRADYDYDGVPDMMYLWSDTDRDGYMDHLSVDVDGDEKPDDFWDLDVSRVRPVSWTFHGVNSAHGPVVKEEPARLYRLNRVLMAALESIRQGSGSDPVWEMMESGMKRENIPADAAERLTGSDETILYYLMLAADRRIVRLKALYKNKPFWKSYDITRGKGDTQAMVLLLSREFKLSPATDYQSWIENIRKKPATPRVAWNNTWFPPNWGWESEKAAFRSYDGHFDIFGKRLDTLIYPAIALGKSYHLDQNGWGMDILHAGKTGGCGGVVLYVDGEAYPVRNNGNPGEPVFTGRLVQESDTRVMLELTATGVGPTDAPYTVKLRPSALAGRRDSPVEAVVEGGDPGRRLALGITLTTLPVENYFVEQKSGVAGSWGFQQPEIGWIGMGIVFRPDQFLYLDDQPDEHRIVLKCTPGIPVRYHIFSDWLRGHRFSRGPGTREWMETLRKEAGKLEHIH